MLKEEIEKAIEAATVINANVLLRSSEHVSSFNYGEILHLPQYHLIYESYRLHSEVHKGDIYFWTPKCYPAQTCAVLEVIYLDAKAPPKLPETEERPLKDGPTIIDAVQQLFPAINRKDPIRNAAKAIVDSYTRSEMIREIDGVLHFDEDFEETRVMNYWEE